MERNELRYRIISALLQADGPLTLRQVVDACQAEAADDPDETAVLPVLTELVSAGQVVQGHLLPDLATPQYAWRARWEAESQSRTVGHQHDLRTALDSVERVAPDELDVESRPSRAFYEYVVGTESRHEYDPPSNKRFLVFLQCSVRRPFSTAPSHAPMRRAIRVATGYDPRKDFAACPVHVVVMASKIGPVPYELEDLYPANVRGGGVKRLRPEAYERVKPILAARMAQYILTFRDCYERITTFTEGRYSEVLEQAREIAVQEGGESLRFPILPRADGARVIRSMTGSEPHQYWARYWIQLYLEVVNWLEPDQRAQAQARLSQLKVEYQT